MLDNIKMEVDSFADTMMFQPHFRSFFPRPISTYHNPYII